jgi:hypothetical protein
MSNLEMKNFTSFDPTDGLGIRAQVKVTKGNLRVKRITPNESGTMAKIDFDVEELGLKHVVHANIPSNTSQFEALKAAKEAGEPIEFRIETQRKQNVDRTRPFPPAKDADRVNDVQYLVVSSGTDVVKKLVSVGGVATAEQVTSTDEDARWSSIPAANLPKFVDENPSSVVSSGGSFDKEVALTGYREAAAAGCSQDFLNTVAAVCVALGVPFADIKAAAAQVKKA